MAIGLTNETKVALALLDAGMHREMLEPMMFKAREGGYMSRPGDIDIAIARWKNEIPYVFHEGEGQLADFTKWKKGNSNGK